jgi:hypothetical protein
MEMAQARARYSEKGKGAGRIPSSLRKPLPYIFPSPCPPNAKPFISPLFELHWLVLEQVSGARISGLRQR